MQLHESQVFTSTTIENAWSARRFIIPIYASAMMKVSNPTANFYREELGFMLRCISKNDWYDHSNVMYNMYVYILEKISSSYKYLHDKKDINCPVYSLPRCSGVTNAADYIHHTISDIVKGYRNRIKWKERGYIYFLLAKEVNLVKIGYQSKVNNDRTRLIHSHCPYDLILLGSVQCLGMSSETEIHRRHKYWHFNREWFRYDDELARRISFYTKRGFYDEEDDDRYANDIELEKYLHLVLLDKIQLKHHPFVKNKMPNDDIVKYIIQYVLLLVEKYRKVKIIKPFLQLN
jgi:hypothetical protein